MGEDNHRLSEVVRRRFKPPTRKRVDKGMPTSKGVAPYGGRIAPDFVPPQRMDKGLGRTSLPSADAGVGGAQSWGEGKSLQRKLDALQLRKRHSGRGAVERRLSDVS